MFRPFDIDEIRQAEDDFLRNWSGSRPDATAALNARFGTQQTNKSVGAKTSKLKERRFVLQKPWSKAEDDFLLRWRGLRQDDIAAVTAALNARFGTQRTVRSVVVRISSLKRKRAWDRAELANTELGAMRLATLPVRMRRMQAETV
ncbi:hypothetical protein EKO27_g7243 [Xylaria grammica]|uniref:Uncharacterized protein n=1 Tax=Xylaria grammica TaxID=363999 RepID=A0A439D0C8_9PEZI|nr:hypothetical protein EKO27_g7243 [Xylaria grammica]